MDDEMVKAQYTVGDRLLDKIDELKESNREVAENIQKLMYYVVVIGALNGTITVGKIVDSVVDRPTDKSSIIGSESKNEHFGATDSRQDKPRQEGAIN